MFKSALLSLLLVISIKATTLAITPAVVIVNDAAKCGTILATNKTYANYVTTVLTPWSIDATCKAKTTYADLKTCFTTYSKDTTKV